MGFMDYGLPSAQYLLHCLSTIEPENHIFAKDYHPSAGADADSSSLLAHPLLKGVPDSLKEATKKAH